MLLGGVWGEMGMSEQMRSIESVFIGGMVSCISSWSLAWNTMSLMSDGLVWTGIDGMECVVEMVSWKW